MSPLSVRLVASDLVVANVPTAGVWESAVLSFDSRVTRCNCCCYGTIDLILASDDSRLEMVLSIREVVPKNVSLLLHRHL